MRGRRRRGRWGRGLCAGVALLGSVVGRAGPAPAQEAPPLPDATTTTTATMVTATTTTVARPETRILSVETPPTTTTATRPPAAATTRPPAAAPPTIRVDTSATRAAVEAAAADRRRLAEEIAGVEARVAAQEAALVEVQDRLAAAQAGVEALEAEVAAAAAHLAQVDGRVARLERSAAAAAEAGQGRSTPVARPPARGHSPADAAAQALRDLAAEVERRRQQQGVLVAREEQLDGAQGSAGGVLAELSGKVEQLRQEREALARLRQQLAEAEQAPGAAGAAALVPAPSALAAGSIPPAYLALYGRAASTCAGLSWRVLAAVGSVESAHGQSTAPSVHQGENYAGAMGPMQFLAPTWAAYGVDATGDGIRDVYNPADAVFGAANYLCASGAGRASALRGALWAYNHADWYVDLVLEVAARY